MRFIFAIAYREYRIRLTNPIFPLWDVMVPVIYLVIFGASFERWLGDQTLGLNYPTFLLGGVLAMVSFSVAMNSAYASFEDHNSGIFQELLTYPFPRRDLLIGRVLFNSTFAVLGAALCLLAARAILHIRISPAALIPLLAWVLFGAAGWYFLFFWIAVQVRGFNAFQTLTSSLYMFLMFLSNLFYPADRLPSWASWLAISNPITWQVDLLRFHIFGTGNLRWLTLESFGFAAFTLLCFWLAARALNNPSE